MTPEGTPMHHEPISPRVEHLLVQTGSILYKEGEEDSPNRIDDAVLRAIDRGIRGYLESESKFNGPYEQEADRLQRDQAQFRYLIMETQEARPDMNDVHLTGLLSRVLLSTLDEDDANYTNTDDTFWFSYLDNLQGDTLGRFFQGLREQTIQTNVPERDRVAQAIMTLIPSDGTQTVMVEIGGSWGATIRMRHIGARSLQPPFNPVHDLTGSIEKTIADNHPPAIAKIINVDLEFPDKKWILTCERPLQREKTAQKLQVFQDGEDVLKGPQLVQLQHDATQPDIVDLLKDENVRVVNMSFVSQQLSYEQEVAIDRNIEQLLKEGGIVIKTKFRRKHQWFGQDWNVETVVQFKINGKLTKEYQYTLADNSRLQTITQGEHFSEVHRLIQLLPSEIVAEFQTMEGRKRRPRIPRIDSVEAPESTTRRILNMLTAKRLVVLNTGPSSHVMAIPEAGAQLTKIRKETVPEPPLVVMPFSILQQEVLDKSRLHTSLANNIELLASATDTFALRIPIRTNLPSSTLPVDPYGYLNILPTREDNPITQGLREIGIRYYLLKPATWAHEQYSRSEYADTVSFAQAAKVPLVIYPNKDRLPHAPVGNYPLLHLTTFPNSMHFGRWEDDRVGILIADPGFMHIPSLKKLLWKIYGNHFLIEHKQTQEGGLVLSEHDLAQPIPIIFDTIRTMANINYP